MVQLPLDPFSLIDKRYHDAATPVPRRRPGRAAAFTARHPDAVWVQTVPECLGKLAERWDEVHLDHDLGGEHYVDSGRDPTAGWRSSAG